jgi:glycosyltransferase involved in cell wall biosynthesis
MRVLCLTNMYPTAQDPAPGSFVREHVDDLRRLGVEVDVLAFDGRVRRSEYGRAALTLRRRLAASRYDLVHAHYGLTGAVALAERRVPVVTTFYGSDIGYVPWQRRVSWFVARLTTPIFVARLLAERVGLARASVIPPGVSLDTFCIRPRTEARQRLGWDEAKRYVLLPGPRSRPVKNARLFDAVLELLRREEPLLRPVALEGFSRSEVATVMNAVDVALMTSLSEGSPVAVKEALACGTPVVSVEVGDVPQVIGGLPGCSLQPRSVERLADGVRAALRAEDREALRQRAAAYDRPAVARLVVDLYRSVLERSAA